MFSSCCPPITLLAAATSRTFSTPVSPWSVTASRSLAPADVEAAPAAVDHSASSAIAVPACAPAPAPPIDRAPRERRVADNSDRRCPFAHVLESLVGGDDDGIEVGGAGSRGSGVGSRGSLRVLGQRGACGRKRHGGADGEGQP